MGCPPPPAKICPGCSPGCGIHNVTHGFAGYWPVVPRALDYVSAVRKEPSVCAILNTNEY
jgi:hypothetical protein